MELSEEIYEIKKMIDCNSEKRGLVQRRLHDLQDEESLYRLDLVRREHVIEDMASILQGDILLKYQSEALASLDDIRSNAETVFLAEKDQLEDMLKALERENEELMRKQHRLMEEL